MFLAAALCLGFSTAAFAEEAALSVYESYLIPTGSVRMTAHRGYSAAAPENTLPAFRLAGESGFWGAECDIARTADGEWILMHDDTVDRMTDGTGRVTDLTFAQIRALTVDAGNNVDRYPGTVVPTLTEYLDVCAQYALHPVIEIKGSASVDDMAELAALLSAREEKARFTVISFSQALSARFKALMPSAPVYLLIGGDTRAAFDDAIRFCLENGLDGLDFACVWDRDAVRAVRSAGLKTMVWTVDDLKTAETYYKMGVRDLTTNRLTPGEPRGNLPQRALRRLRDLAYALFVKPFEQAFGSRVC